MATSKSEALEITIELLINSALASLKTLTEGTAEYATTLNDIKVLVDQYAKSAGIAFGSASAAIGANTGKVNELNAALLKLGELKMQQGLGLANKADEVAVQKTLNDLEMAQLNINKQEGLVNKANQAEQLAFMKTLEAAQLNLARERGLAQRQSQTTDMLFSPNQPAPTGRFAGQYGKFDTGAGTAMYDSWKNVGPMLQETGKKAESAARGFNILRTAAGFLTAMILSKIATGITQVFQKIIDSASQAEQAFIKLSIAQKAITRGGTAISSNELLGIIDKVAAAYLSVSKIDAQKMVSSLAVLTKDLKLSASEYEKMAMAIPLIAQQAGVSIESATDQVITGLTKSGRGWADLGITVDAEIIKQKAVSSGLVKTREAYEALTAEQKQQVEVLALLEILEENTIDNKAKQEAYNNTLSGSQVALNAAWEDFAATLGKFAAPTIIQFLQELTKSLQGMNDWLEKNKTSVSELSAQFAGLSAVAQLYQQRTGGSIGGIIGATLFGSEEVEKTYADAYEQAKKYQRDTFELTDGRVDKGARDDFAPIGGVSPEDEAKRQEALDKFAQEMAELELKSAQEREDIAIELGRDLVDIETEYDRKRADVQRDYNDKVRDINQSYNEDIADIKQKQAEDDQKRKNDDLKREQEYQNKLLEMRENYLMSLDDALHSRDARQVLKLMRQYELDKLQAARRHDLDNQQAAADEKLRRQEIVNEIKKAQIKREIALKEAQQERDDKLAQMVIDEKREIEDARLKAKRKNDDLRKANSDRAALMAAQLAWEQKYTGEWMTRMLRLYGQYYTNIAQVYRNLRAMESAGAMAIGNATSPYSNNNGYIPGKSVAVGGTPITQRLPGKKDASSILPRNRISSTNAGAGSAGSSGANGRVTVELNMSPDLEARIVSNSLNQTADVITRIQRGKSRSL
jgi:hypothetical protein